MPVLDNGVVLGEGFNALNFTPMANVKAIFGYEPIKTGATVHHWGNDGQSFDDVLNFLKSRNSRNNSAHIVLQEDRVECIVNTDDAAWHSGHPLGNAQTIGIECRPEMTPGDLATLASLLRYLEKFYGSLLIYPHNYWQNTACPGRYLDQLDELIDAINGVEIAPAPSEPVHLDDDEHECCCCHKHVA